MFAVVGKLLLPFGAALLIFSGCSGSKSDNLEKVSAVCTQFVEASAKRDYSKLRQLVHPDALRYYEQNGKRFTLETYMNSLSDNVPELKEGEEVIFLDCVLRDHRELTGSYGDKMFYDLLPDQFKTAIGGVVRYRIGTSERGEFLFLMKYEDTYKVVVPDVTVLWSLEDLKERLMAKGQSPEAKQQAVTTAPTSP